MRLDSWLIFGILGFLTTTRPNRVLQLPTYARQQQNYSKEVDKALMILATVLSVEPASVLEPCVSCLKSNRNLANTHKLPPQIPALTVSRCNTLPSLKALTKNFSKYVFLQSLFYTTVTKTEDHNLQKRMHGFLKHFSEIFLGPNYVAFKNRVLVR